MPYENGRYVPPSNNRRKPPSPLIETRRRYNKGPKIKRSLPRINPIVLVMGVLLLLGLVKLLTM